MGTLLRSLTAAFVISLGVTPGAHATDRRIDGLRLVLKRVGTTTKLSFVSRDPDFLFPPIPCPASEVCTAQTQPTPACGCATP